MVQMEEGALELEHNAFRVPGYTYYRVETGPLFRTRITTCYPDRVETGALFSYQDYHVLSQMRKCAPGARPATRPPRTAPRALCTWAWEGVGVGTSR